MRKKVQQDVDDDEEDGTVWEIALGLVMIVLLMVGAYLLCVMLPVFLIVTMVLVLKGLIMKLSGKDTADYWKKNFSRMSVLHRLFNSLFPLSWILGRGGKSSGGSSGNDDDRDDDYDSYDSGSSGDGGSFGGGGAGRDF